MHKDKEESWKERFNQIVSSGGNGRKEDLEDLRKILENQTGSGVCFWLMYKQHFFCFHKPEKCIDFLYITITNSIHYN